VSATAKRVGRHVALYVDGQAPAAGLDSVVLDTLETTFDTRLYPIDTTAFGRESDIDSNSVVIVLMTGVVNSLVTATECATSGFVAGFFFPPDIDPRVSTSYNHGEIFYTLVPDPAGTLSCPHSATSVKRIVGSVFMHEFQHMINFNQHMLLRGGPAEDTWLNEGLSKLAEELGGRSYLPFDRAGFSDYVTNELYEAYQYLTAPGRHSLLTTTELNLGDVGAGWLFVRYLVDQYGDTGMAGTTFTRKLEQTSTTGATNVATQTGILFTTLVTRWALANWVSDLPGFSAPPELRYRSWSYRTTYASLHMQDSTDFPRAFPLVPTLSAGARVSLKGELYAGSGAYARAVEPPTDPGFTLRLSDGAGGPLPVEILPRLNVIRIR
jgi:hypothetical protein